MKILECEVGKGEEFLARAMTFLRRVEDSMGTSGTKIF